MTVEQFDAELNQIADTFIAQMTAASKTFQNAMLKATETAKAAGVPDHLAIASITSMLVRIKNAEKALTK